jgi:hypothetical protein
MAQHPRLHVGHTAKWIHQMAIIGTRNRVDGEITAT